MQVPSLSRSPWPFRFAWLILPVLSGPALADALSDRSRSVQVVASLMAWGLWAVTLSASLVPRTITLTVLRLVVPGALVSAAWAATATERVGWGTAALVGGALCLVAVASPGVTDTFVDGSSYGPERRMALRVPGVLAAVVLPLAWATAAAGAITGPLLLAAGQWLAGTVGSLLGAAVVAVVARQFHLLSRRWLVFVPAGMVVHDPMTLREPVLFPRHLLRRIGPADPATDALDTTAGALGLVLEVETAAPMTVPLRRGRATSDREDVRALLVTPVSPAAVLEVAADQRLPVG